MSRENRIEFENSFHHVIVRGYQQMNIFLDEDDFSFFLKQVLIVSLSHGIIIHSFCLMNNHLHLLLQNPLVNLSKSMQLILTRYASYFKRKYKHRGKVIEKRFTSYLVDTELYLMQLSKYIHRNPLGVIVDKLEDWAWSSYKYFINKNLEQPRFLETELLLKKHRNLNSLIEYTSEPDDWKPEDHIFSNTILGSDKFIREITLKHIAPNIDTEIKGSYKLNKTYKYRIEEIKDLISKITKDRKLKKQLLLFALREKTSMSYKVISQEFFQGRAKISSLSDIYSRIKKKASTDPIIKKAINCIRTL